MRVLFYLPVVTREWMSAIIRPLIEVAARTADVHILVPPRWAGTGLDPADLASHRAIGRTSWHVFDAPDHPSLRTTPSHPDALMRLVRAIDPDYTFCRSADRVTPCGFPGKTAFLMEGDFPPLAARRRIRISGPALFDLGVMPRLDDEQRAFLAGWMAPLAKSLLVMRAGDPGARARFLAANGLPDDRRIIALPLEHDGEDNFYMMHSPAPVNAPFVQTLGDRLGKDAVLALTVHPAQRQDQAAMDRLECLAGDKVRIVGAANGGDVTPALVRHCDGIVLRDSKAFVWPALFGKPIFRLSRFVSAPWLYAYSDFDQFQEALRACAARIPDLDEALVWIGFHLANNAFSAADPDLDLDELIGRIDGPFDPARWDRALRHAKPDLDAAATSIQTIGA